MVAHCIANITYTIHLPEGPVNLLVNTGYDRHNDSLETNAKGIELKVLSHQVEAESKLYLLHQYHFWCV